MSRTRTEPREEALQALYAADQRAGAPDCEGISSRARALVEGVWEEKDLLDDAIGKVSARWRVERMPAVDRNVLRLALHELRHRPGTPTAVILSEAVRIAKLYSTERSGAFINGVLARLAEIERESSSGGMSRPPGTDC